jgi:hypothetical protein
MPPSLHSSLRALATSFVPETAGASDVQWAVLEARVEQALSVRPQATRRQLGLFVTLLAAAARVRYRTALTSLDPARRIVLLEWFGRSPVLRFRLGIWGLRTLIMLGWYTQPSVIEALGYRADPAGWDAIR